MANLLGLKDGFNLDTDVGAQNLHLFLKGSGTMMVGLSSVVFLAASVVSVLRKNLLIAELIKLIG